MFLSCHVHIQSESTLLDIQATIECGFTSTQLYEHSLKIGRWNAENKSN